MKQLHQPLTDEEIKEIFVTADANGDGYISYEGQNNNQSEQHVELGFKLKAALQNCEVEYSGQLFLGCDFNMSL